MQNYFLGLDIGTDSVGYAAANEAYDLLKRKGEPVWGVTLFEEANLNTERRAFRTARRRLDRRQQRIQLLQELFASEVAKFDAGFFNRIKNSALWREDAGEPYCIFNDDGYTSRDYRAEYPTIHHLLVHLMKTDEPQDIRFVYLACAWLVAHRGHFLSDVSKENVAALMDFRAVHENLIAWFTQRDVKTPDGLDHGAVLERVLCENTSVSRKYDHLKKELFNGKKPPKHKDDYVDTECFLKLLCGSKGAKWKAQPFMPFHEEYHWNRYLKRLEVLCEKLKEHPDYPVDKEQDGVDEETNLKLYDLYIDKLKHSIYQKRPNNPVQLLEKGREAFRNLSAGKQAQTLLSIHQIFGRIAGGCDLQSVGGAQKAAASQLSSNFSNLKKYYTDVRIIDTSAAGLYEHKSPNLLDFLEDA